MVVGENQSKQVINDGISHGISETSIKKSKKNKTFYVMVQSL